MVVATTMIRPPVNPDAALQTKNQENGNERSAQARNDSAVTSIAPRRSTVEEILFARPAPSRAPKK